MPTATSPNGGSVQERGNLKQRFVGRMSINHKLTRKAVSYQGNRRVPGFRWMKYKEAFSRSLVEDLIEEYEPSSVLDPFSGIGTAPLIAAGQGLRGTGIEIMPVGVLVGEGIAEVANGLSKADFEEAGRLLLAVLHNDELVPAEYGFPHVRITESAFPESTEDSIARARKFVEQVADPRLRKLLNLACMTILEDVSYTRKDGQYLRWDYRSGRNLRSRVNKGPIPTFEHALGLRLFEMIQDFDGLKVDFGGGYPELMVGSSLDLLRKIPDESYDMVITSPPYANRYDYTRTYALELAWLGFDQQDFSDLRQRMLTATVENRPKWAQLQCQYHERGGLLSKTLQMYRGQAALQEVLDILRQSVRELSNRHVIRLIEGYFLEMAIVIAELGRVIRPGGAVIMVNDNVQYHGEEVPADLILSDFAEQSGFHCEKIWTLPRGKGNSSQQMHRFGRREIRKCVYIWKRTND